MPKGEAYRRYALAETAVINFVRRAYWEISSDNHLVRLHDCLIAKATDEKIIQNLLDEGIRRITTGRLPLNYKPGMKLPV
jgi:hypothetical protein